MKPYISAGIILASVLAILQSTAFTVTDMSRTERTLIIGAELRSTTAGVVQLLALA